MKIYNLKNFFEDHGISIPSYQRVYTWQKEEIEYYFTDIKEDLYKDRKTNFGVIYYDDSRSPGKLFQIIDGQQRLTTSVLILATLAIRNRNFKKATEFTETILKDRKFSSEIGELQKIYDEFYVFLNKALTNRDWTFENLCRHFVKREVKNRKSNEESSNKIKPEENFNFDQNDLLSSMKVINALLNDRNKEWPSEKDMQEQILKAEFYLLKNPYLDDPISIFERLNNRGKELSFISMSKIRIYEFFEKKIKIFDEINSNELALKYMRTYTELIYSIFNNSSSNFKIENRDSRIESALVDYLIMHFEESISKSRTERLIKFNEFLEEKIKLNKSNYNDTSNKLEVLLNEFLIFASVSLVNEKTKDFKSIYYLNKNDNDKLCVETDDFILENLKKLEDLDKIKLKKFKPFYRYMITQILLNSSLVGGIDDEEMKKLNELLESVLVWTATYYVSKVGAEIDITFREDMDLYKFIKEYNLITNPSEKITKIKKSFVDKTNEKYNLNINKFKQFNSAAEKDWIKPSVSIKMEKLKDILKDKLEIQD